MPLIAFALLIRLGEQSSWRKPGQIPYLCVAPHIGHCFSSGKAPESMSPSGTPSSLATRKAKAGVAHLLMWITRVTVVRSVFSATATCNQDR